MGTITRTIKGKLKKVEGRITGAVGNFTNLDLPVDAPQVYEDASWGYTDISILKDAAASVYGFRAANGVVLVTTKRGSTQRTEPP